MKTIYEFFKFLNTHCAQEKFIRNLIKERGYSDSIDWIISRITGEFGNIIDVAFIWSSTPEGHDFWSNLHGKFRDYWNEKIQPHDSVFLSPNFPCEVTKSDVGWFLNNNNGMNSDIFRALGVDPYAYCKSIIPESYVHSGGFPEISDFVRFQEIIHHLRHDYNVATAEGKIDNSWIKRCFDGFCQIKEEPCLVKEEPCLKKECLDYIPDSLILHRVQVKIVL